MCDSYDSIVFHLEKKYLCDQHVESFIDIFGTSPCKLANERGLELLVLDRKNISSIGDINRFASHVKNVTELDLSWNKINSWSTISTLLTLMPSLKLLNISHNPIEQNIPEFNIATNFTELKKNEQNEALNYVTTNNKHENNSISNDNYLNKNLTDESCSNNKLHDPSEQFSNISNFSVNKLISLSFKLSTLILNGVKMPFSTLQKFVSVFPSLNELHIGKNLFDLTELEQILKTDLSFSNTVRVLNLNACNLQNWGTVLSLVKLFPYTECLYLAENKIEYIENEANKLKTEKICQFIRSITLSNNKLKTWSSIENLSLMRQLEELRVRNIPLFDECSFEERYHLIVGRLKSLTCLNGSTITPFQREESERFFIRYYQCSKEQPQMYFDLVAEHGHLEQLVKVDLTPRRFAKVVIRCDETNYLRTTRIRLSNTVMDLLRHAEKITGIPIQRIRLFYFDVNVSGLGPTELRFPNQVLQSLHIDDGDEFFIQSKILLPKQHRN